MKKNLINLFIMLVAVISFASISISTSAFGQDKYSVSGEIYFLEEQGEFQVRLMTLNEYENNVRQVPPTRNLLIKPNSQQLKAKKISFKFVDIPSGTYCIFCFHDLNKNGKMDRVPETGFPTEPFTFSGMLLYGAGMWEDLSFKVDKNVSGIEIKF
jgi:uncharacterized protein (DUF2141 family)